jgi:hypothetical protein
MVQSPRPTKKARLSSRLLSIESYRAGASGSNALPETRVLLSDARVKRSRRLAREINARGETGNLHLVRRSNDPLIMTPLTHLTCVP